MVELELEVRFEHAPNRGSQSAPQYALVLPQKPYLEQQGKASGQVYPDSEPQLLSGLMIPFGIVFV